METNNGIKVKIFDLEHGLVEYEDIKFIRIVSKEYNLLIMKDYMPILGEIDGSISFKNEEINVEYNPIRAYYVHSDNVFSLMIKDE